MAQHLRIVAGSVLLAVSLGLFAQGALAKEDDDAPDRASDASGLSEAVSDIRQVQLPSSREQGTAQPITSDIKGFDKAYPPGTEPSMPGPWIDRKPGGDAAPRPLVHRSIHAGAFHPGRASGPGPLTRRLEPRITGHGHVGKHLARRLREDARDQGAFAPKGLFAALRQGCRGRRQPHRQ